MAEEKEINEGLKTAQENAEQREAMNKHLEWDNDELKTALKTTAIERD